MTKEFCKIMLLAGTILCSGISAVNAQTCTVAPTCESLGYTMSAANCTGKKTLKCPFDTNKLYCDSSSNWAMDDCLFSLTAGAYSHDRCYRLNSIDGCKGGQIRLIDSVVLTDAVLESSLTYEKISSNAICQRMYPNLNPGDFTVTGTLKAIYGSMSNFKNIEINKLQFDSSLSIDFAENVHIGTLEEVSSSGYWFLNFRGDYTEPDKTYRVTIDHLIINMEKSDVHNSFRIDVDGVFVTIKKITVKGKTPILLMISDNKYQNGVLLYNNKYYYSDSEDYYLRF